jgi:hypothetical protein
LPLALVFKQKQDVIRYLQVNLRQHLSVNAPLIELHDKDFDFPDVFPCGNVRQWVMWLPRSMPSSDVVNSAIGV